MTCHKIREQFWEYQRGRLSEELLGSLENHLRTCQACAAEFSQLQNVDQLLESLPAIEPSPYFEQRLNARLKELERQSSSKTFLSQWWKDRYVWTFALLLVATVGLWLGFRHQQSQQLNSMEAVIKVQDDYLGKKKPSETPHNAEIVIREKPAGLVIQKESGEEAVSAEDESIPDEDLEIVENFELLENYEFLRKFDLADVPAKSSSGVKAN